MNFLKRLKRPKMGLRESSVVRCPGHLKWVRGFPCVCSYGNGFAECTTRMEAHHLQSFRAIEGGMGMKVGDDKCVPLCSFHHQAIHQLGQPRFETIYNVPLENRAAMFWEKSPHGVRCRQQQTQDLAP